MRKNLYFVNILLVAEVGLICLISILIKTFAPAAVLPRVSIPLFVLLSVIPMVIQYYIAPEAKGNLLATILIAGVTFTILPVCANVTIGIPVWKLFVASMMIFGATSIIYTSIGQRISSGPDGRFAPVVNGMMLYLASQCLQGLL